jgi:DNA/RNA endonuclease G (NUC1)
MAAAKSVAWGDQRQASVAIRQAFFWTNMVPQAADVNRWSWLSLEEMERERARVEGRVVGFSGPILRSDDPLHVVTDEIRGRLHARQTFRLPKGFWKIFAWRRHGSLETACFVVPNQDGRNPSMRPRPQSIQEIESLTGLEFADSLRSADLA